MKTLGCIIAFLLSVAAVLTLGAVIAADVEFIHWALTGDTWHILAPSIELEI